MTTEDVHSAFSPDRSVLNLSINYQTPPTPATPRPRRLRPVMAVLGTGLEGQVLGLGLVPKSSLLALYIVAFALLCDTQAVVHCRVAAVSLVAHYKTVTSHNQSVLWAVVGN